jgi:hypothetical protein
LNNQDFGYNNVRHAVTTWYHKFNDDNPCYAPFDPLSPTCTFSSSGRSATFDQNGGKRSQAMLATDAIFNF